MADRLVLKAEARRENQRTADGFARRRDPSEKIERTSGFG
jgi:hypothetical protein